MRHLIVGDSHIASLKLGWDEISKHYADTSLVFAGARGQRMQTIYLDGSTLTSTSRRNREMFEQLTGSTDPIDIKAFDKCWIVGGRLGVAPVHRLYLGYRCARHDDLGVDAQILSTRAWDVAVSGLLDEAFGLELARSIAAQEVPVGLIPKPMPSELAYTEDPLRQLDSPELIDELNGLYLAALRDIGDRVGATIHPQPADTLASPLKTLDHFSRGSIGLLREAPHPDHDHTHMAASYGRRVIETHILRSPVLHPGG